MVDNLKLTAILIGVLITSTIAMATDTPKAGGSTATNWNGPHAYSFVINTKGLAALLGTTSPIISTSDIIEVFVGGYPMDTSLTIQTTYSYDGVIYTNVSNQISGQYDNMVVIWITDASKAKVVEVVVNGELLYPENKAMQRVGRNR